MTLFERRELVRILRVPAKYIQQDIQKSLQDQLASCVEGRCGVDGYVARKSSVILEYSLGKIDLTSSLVSYRVRFQADVCMPHVGQELTANVLYLTDLGPYAELPPLHITLARDLQIDDPAFHDIQVGDNVSFKIIGVTFTQASENIIVFGEFLHTDTIRVPEEVVPAPVADLPNANTRKVIVPETEKKRMVLKA